MNPSEVIKVLKCGLYKGVGHILRQILISKYADGKCR
jgi:hypothetical protein